MDTAALPVADPVRVGRLLLVPAWVVVIGLDLLVATHFVAWDRLLTLTALNAQTVWVYLPAYLVASAALSFRRVVLGALAAVAVVFHVWAVATTIGSAEAIPDAARTAPQLRVLSVNLKFDNPTPDRLADEILAVGADVLMLQEVTPRWLDRLVARTGAEYPHRVAEPLGGARGGAILSRVPLDDVAIDHPGGWPVVHARADLGATSVTLVNVHLIGPTQGLDRHRRMAEDVADLVAAMPEPRIVAGDFNATPFNWSLRHIVDETGLDNAHERRGRGLVVTWPNRDHRLIPPIHIDHVFVDDQVVVFDIDELDGSGSDHRPVLVDLAVLP